MLTASNPICLPWEIGHVLGKWKSISKNANTCALQRTMTDVSYYMEEEDNVGNLRQAIIVWSASDKTLETKYLQN